MIKKCFKKIFDVLTSIIIVLLILCLIANSQKQLFGKKYNSIFGYSVLEVKTGSMVGTIEIGDWVLVKAVDKVELGDVITYESDDSLITHRIVEVYGDKYICKGDSNNTKDLPITKDQIVGKLVKVMPKFGIIKKTLLDPAVLGIAALVFLVADLLLSDISKDLSNLIKKKTKVKQINKEENNGISDEEIENLKMVLSDDNTKDYSQTMVLSKVTVDMGESNLKRLVEDDDLKEVIKKSGGKIDSHLIKLEDLKEKDEPEVEEEEVVEEETEAKEITEEEASKVDTSKAEEKYQEEQNAKNSEIEDAIIDEEEKEIALLVEENDKKNDKILIGEKIKNLVGKSMELKKHQLLDITNVLLENNKLKGKENTLVNKSVEKYIELKYTFQNDYADLEVRDYVKEVNKKLCEYFDELLENSKVDKDFIVRLKGAFVLVNLLDYEKAEVSKILKVSPITFKNKEKVEKKLEEYISRYKKVYTDFFNKISNDKFSLSLKKVCSLDNDITLYNTNIKSDIEFDKMFSEIFIEKSYQSDMILEDLREVQLKLISIKILNDMLSTDYKHRYIISFPNSMYDKKRKTISVLNTINDTYSQGKVYILIGLDTLKVHYKDLEELKLRGYHFVIEFSKDNIRLIDDLKKLLLVVDYIFITGGDLSRSDRKMYIPANLSTKVLYADKTLFNEVVTK